MYVKWCKWQWFTDRDQKLHIFVNVAWKWCGERKKEEKSKPKRRKSFSLFPPNIFTVDEQAREEKLCKNSFRLKMSAKPSHTRLRICLTFTTLLLNASAPFSPEMTLGDTQDWWVFSFYWISAYLLLLALFKNISHHHQLVITWFIFGKFYKYFCGVIVRKDEKIVHKNTHNFYGFIAHF
jgi:hypothetical protein